MKNKEAIQYLEDYIGEGFHLLEQEIHKASKNNEDLKKLIDERNNLLDEIDYLKDAIDMEKGVNEHLKSILDRTEHLLECEKAKNKELEAKIIALSIKEK